jgi:hypothetical protein
VNPEGQLHLIVSELHDRKVVEMDAFQNKDGEQGLHRADELARQEPNPVAANHRRDRPQQIDGVDMADKAVDQIGSPPRQRRMLPIAELPFLAEGEVLGEVELQIGADEDGQHGPDEEMSAQDHAERRARLAARIVDDRCETATTGRRRD